MSPEGGMEFANSNAVAKQRVSQEATSALHDH